MTPPPHAKLEVYRQAVAALALAESVIPSIPPAHGHLSDQLRRAAASVVLNLAEGAAEYSPREKTRFYRMSRRSAAECLAVLDILRAIAATGPPAARARSSFERVMALTTRLVRAIDSRSSP